MAIDTEQEARDAADFAAAFNDDPAMAAGTGAMNDDPDAAHEREEPAGTDESAEGEGDGGGAEAGAAGTDGVPTERQQPGDAGGEADSSAAVADTPTGSQDSGATTGTGGELDVSGDDTPPEDAQRAKSWEGRLKARESELKARAEELDAREAKLAAQPEGTKVGALEDVGESATNPEMAAAAADMAERVENGELSADEAIASLKEDFGEPFVNMITTVARTAVKKDLEDMRKSHQEDMDSIADRYDREHVETIAEAHPDAFEIAGSDDFKAWVAKEGKEGVVQNGSARQINKLLDQFKAESKPAELPAASPAAPATVPAASDQEVEAATGVRSSSPAVPPRPRAAASDDYEGAWERA